MVLIHANRDIPASLDSVWNIISDIDREPEYKLLMTGLYITSCANVSTSAATELPS
jgi:hypothetical protein